MNLVYIYGPPAVGKWSVGNELSKLTRYKFLHNHSVNDVMDIVIDKNKYFTEFWKEAGNMKIRLMKIAVKYKQRGLIFTTVHVKTKDSHKFPLKVKKTIEEKKGRVYFVHLNANPNELRKRVKGKTRRQFNKMNTVKRLNSFIKNLDVHSPYSFKPKYYLEIDTTNISPKKQH